MPKRSRNTDDAEEGVKSAFAALQHVIETTEGQPEKNPAAVSLGRLGGLKGGHARAKALSKKRRSQIAKKAALTRWGKK
jgi:hypothetical protein